MPAEENHFNYCVVRGARLTVGGVCMVAGLIMTLVLAR
jgi:hypothetical protein